MKLTKTRIVLGSLLLLIAAVLLIGREPTRTPAAVAPLAAHGAFSDPVLVVGGTKGTGLEIVKILRQRGDPVTVMARNSSNTRALEALGVKIVRGDALKPTEVAAAFAGQSYSALISTLGTTGKDRPRPDFDGNRNVFEAGKAVGIRRVILITTIGAGDSKGREPWLAGQFLKEIIALKTQTEDYLAKSGLDYTIIRPGGLLGTTKHKRAFLTEDTESFSWITRTDLAELVVRALDDPQAINKIYHAFDPDRTRFWSMRELSDR
jgi:uncharacterized protein YbjT (DUF2867 family)